MEKQLEKGFLSIDGVIEVIKEFYGSVFNGQTKFFKVRITNPAGIYLLQVNITNTTMICIHIILMFFFHHN